jgi:hypothetical protein
MPSKTNAVGNLEVQSSAVDAGFLAALNDRLRRIGSVLGGAASSTTTLVKAINVINPVTTTTTAPSGQTAVSSSAVSGSATLNFGSAPGTNRVFVNVTGQSGILATSTISCFLMYDTTPTHNGEEHLFVALNVSAGTIVPGVGFTIYAVTELRLSGTFTVRWTWLAGAAS